MNPPLSPSPCLPVSVSFFVPGRAQPAGSKRGFAFKGRDGRNHVAISDANPKAAGWKQDVKHTARQEYAGKKLLTGPICATFKFFALRPKYHFTSKGALRPAFATARPTSKPDALKLARGVEDALTGVIYQDDSQIVEEHLYKHYGEYPGVLIELTALPLTPCPPSLSSDQPALL